MKKIKQILESDKYKNEYNLECHNISGKEFFEYTAEELMEKLKAIGKTNRIVLVELCNDIIEIVL